MERKNFQHLANRRQIIYLKTGRVIFVASVEQRGPQFGIGGSLLGDSSLAVSAPLLALADAVICLEMTPSGTRHPDWLGGFPGPSHLPPPFQSSIQANHCSSVVPSPRT